MSEILRAIPTHMKKKLLFRPLSDNGNTLTIESAYPLDDKKTMIIKRCLREAGYGDRNIARIPANVTGLTNRLARTETVNDGDMAAKAALLNSYPGAAIASQFFDLLFLEAVQARASDIFLRRVASGGSIEYRIFNDKILKYYLLPDAIDLVVGILRDRAQLDHAQRNRDQDGEFTLRYGDREVVIRVAAMPLHDGHAYTCRALDPTAVDTLDDLLAYDGAALETIKSLTKQVRKDGLVILFSGSTGTGKTTMLRGAIMSIDRVIHHVLTAEDPVEYRLPHVNQTQVNKHLGFPDFVRSALRHSPDVIVIGEARDRDTLNQLFAAAERGPYILATVHAPNIDAVTSRILNDFTLEELPHIAARLQQHMALSVHCSLIPKLCSNCRIPHGRGYRPNHRGCAFCYHGNAGVVQCADIIMYDVSANRAKKSPFLPGTQTLDMTVIYRRDRSEIINALALNGVIDIENYTATTEPDVGMAAQ